ncbi:hypothetical protein C8F04DRAFT_1191420 [Mycena alexandri]|uniref:Uncharacterized protein n=1 Tax=Mycena alexandri TaxID=1745969 RepID=A0AAD6SDA0_9AGAR|nr:hypothetical protein C8F04DRAFT_1191420 [Mycena alexandri]
MPRYPALAGNKFSRERATKPASYERDDDEVAKDKEQLIRQDYTLPIPKELSTRLKQSKKNQSCPIPPKQDPGGTHQWEQGRSQVHSEDTTQERVMVKTWGPTLQMSKSIGRSQGGTAIPRRAKPVEVGGGEAKKAILKRCGVDARTEQRHGIYARSKRHKGEHQDEIGASRAGTPQEPKADIMSAAWGGEGRREFGRCRGVLVVEGSTHLHPVLASKSVLPTQQTPYMCSGHRHQGCKTANHDEGSAQRDERETQCEHNDAMT